MLSPTAISTTLTFGPWAVAMAAAPSRTQAAIAIGLRRPMTMVLMPSSVLLFPEVHRRDPPRALESRRRTVQRAFRRVEPLRAVGPRHSMRRVRIRPEEGRL